MMSFADTLNENIYLVRGTEGDKEYGYLIRFKIKRALLEGMNNLSALAADYSNKKGRIKERLSQFEKFFDNPYSWFYNNNELVLLPVEKSNDQRLFEELCFCIFAANTSAEMSAKSVDAVR